MFRINQRSAQPIYEQILENIENLIISGALLKDEQLPSVRSVAKDLAVNPNTIQKAYGLLEERGIIYSRPGRGSFVAVDGEALKDQRLPQAFTQLDQAVDVLKDLYVSLDDILARVTTRFQSEKEGGERL
ncbi:MAG: GntR family transcriptional regulator [Peptococcaceae bacterium]|nr:GntR family transcriptional regulator [Peptococcaceae bacterium]